MGEEDQPGLQIDGFRIPWLVIVALCGALITYGAQQHQISANAEALQKKASKAKIEAKIEQLNERTRDIKDKIDFIYQQAYANRDTSQQE